MTRTVLHEPSVRRVRMLDKDHGIGGLWINSFTEETTQQFGRGGGRSEEEGLKSLVLDLRFNGGGVLDSAAEIANRFLPSGVIYEQRGRKAPTRYEARPERATIAGMPVAMLVNGDSASASEVLAAALSDHGVAAIVGDRTYGKGVVQSLRRFDDNGAYIKITTAYYFHTDGAEPRAGARGGSQRHARRRDHARCPRGARPRRLHADLQCQLSVRGAREIRGDRGVAAREQGLRSSRSTIRSCRPRSR